MYLSKLHFCHPAVALGDPPQGVTIITMIVSIMFMFMIVIIIIIISISSSSGTITINQTK